jgi:type IV pilus assembly protein PilV
MPRRTFSNKQGGALLLEAMIAILLFSLGVLSLVGMQAMAVTNVSEAKYRTDASFYANQLIGQIWVNRDNIADYAFAGGTPSDALEPWLDQVTAALPGVVDNPPQIDIAGSQVTVTILWQSPEEAAKDPQPDPHQYSVTTTINCC